VVRKAERGTEIKRSDGGVARIIPLRNIRTPPPRHVLLSAGGYLQRARRNEQKPFLELDVLHKCKYVMSVLLLSQSSSHYDSLRERASGYTVLNLHGYLHAVAALTEGKESAVRTKLKARLAH
jgi:hypothetical protein